ncbi:MAG TPA: tetratricopeptide repeat protein, partial [Pseudomonadota bacterium]|nr:tetratricopeptide repeat protein [Pseudomonadota bacterium]
MNPTHAQHLRLAAQALGRGDTAMARAACHALLREEPDNADALNLLGLCEAQAGNPAVAMGALERAVAANPAYGNAWRNLAALREATGDAPGAALALGEALARDPKAGYADWYALGVRLHGAGRPGRAVEAFAQALKQRPDDIAALNNLAVAQYASGRQREARDSAERLLARDPARAASRATFAAIWATATEPAGL